MSNYMPAPLASAFTPALTDEQVAVRIQLGETQLYELLAERHKRRFCLILRRILPNPDDVEDVLQQAHLRALQYIRQFEGRSTLLTWLTRIVINEAYTHLRRRRDVQPLDGPAANDDRYPREFAATEASPEQRAILGELLGMLESGIASLPQSYRAVISLRLIREMPVADTAACLGISKQGVKARLLRAKRLLQRELRDGGVEEKRPSSARLKGSFSRCDQNPGDDRLGSRPTTEVA
jgi:RNA polymerase sigma-70 factor (ECF subfamily)